MVGQSRLIVIALAVLAATLGLSACGETGASNFKGESHAVAQTVSDFQSDVTARDEKKVCENDLAATLKTSLQKNAGGCRAALKKQLLEVDSPTLTIESVAIKGTTASARVKSLYSGKNRLTTMTLVKEGSRWKISGTG
jgi:hypothetical protein